MKKLLLIFTFVVCYRSKDVTALRLPGPQVYVVTPSSRPLQIDEGTAAPFYYQNWMRRMDTPQSSTTTTVAPKVKTPDLIFAEFDSDGNMQKSIRKLLEKEKIKPKTTTAQPIYVPDEETTKVTRIVNYGLPVKMEAEEGDDKYTNPENIHDIINGQGQVYLPSTTTTTTTTKTSTTPHVNIENIWHIIDNEKLNQQPGNWDEISIDTNDEKEVEVTNQYQPEIKLQNNTEGQEDDSDSNRNDGDVKIDDNFALPGFSTNPGNGAENESRAIRTEPNIRFPYVNLKPFQMKTPKKPILNNKKNNMFSLDNFYDLKDPVRGEAQDISSVSHQIDRYNPAQPYLPKQEYGGGVSKQSTSLSGPIKATANLVPPPPPRISGNDFPSPSSYESFPPYPPSSINFPSAPAPAPAPAPKPQLPSMNTLIAPSMEVSVDTDSSDDGDDNSVMDLSYRYKPPSAPVPQFIPTAPPVQFDGYSYNKPSIPADTTPPVADKPDFQGYPYNKPAPGPPSNEKPNFQGYHYSKPDVPQFFDNKPSGYGSHDAPPTDHDSDYPDLIFSKPHGDTKGRDDMNGDDMGMMPPPAPADMSPQMDDHGFPSDFPGDLKFHHDFDDHDHYHYHHHHTTTTTTTEMPRVNRYSYYYLGKKLYYLPLYFSVYFIVYVGALIIKAILRHKIVYPNSWRPNTTTASFFSKRSVDSYLSNNDNLHELTGRVTHAIATAAEKYMRKTSKSK